MIPPQNSWFGEEQHRRRWIQKQNQTKNKRTLLKQLVNYSRIILQHRRSNATVAKVLRLCLCRSCGPISRTPAEFIGSNVSSFRVLFGTSGENRLKALLCGKVYLC